MKAVEAREITFTYQGQTSPVLDRIDFSLEAGEIAALTGLSGCGKSTLGYCLCGVIPRLIKGDFSGEVILRGRPGIVFQDPDTQIFMPSVEAELAFGPENLGLPRGAIAVRIADIAELVGINDLLMLNPAQLSGGQKQLVALGGVLTLSPDIIVMDETLAQLDAATQENVKRILMTLKQHGKAIIIIEHDISNLDIADQIWLLERDGLLRMPARKASANE
ncbi:MAG: ABC transporter ATP-binding protein [Syntrophomonadaceae bacterium]|nr:ABC transporter ATP-binding protein [Syntrophomonadaceae bacterium]